MIRKKTVASWLKHFEYLSIVKSNKLLKKINSVLIGLELKSIPGFKKYKLYFVIYPLYGNNDGNDLKSCLSYPVLMRPFVNVKDDMEVEFGYDSFLSEDVIKLVKEQFPLKWDRSACSVQEIGSVIDDQIQLPPLSAKSNSFLVAEILKNKYMILRMGGEYLLAANALLEIKNTKWDDDHFKLWGTDVYTWIRELENIDFIELKNIVINNTPEV